MNLKSFGCSFIFGSELADADRKRLFITTSKFTWPALYADMLGYEYCSDARPGAGNLQIAERTLNELAKNEHALYVIGWTWIDRFDYYVPNFKNRWKTIMPADESSMADTYYRNIHSQYRDKLTTLMSIRSVIDTLKEKKYPFIMTYMDELMFETEWHSSPAVAELQNYIRPYMTTFEGLNFLDWSKTHGYPVTENWHPLEAAHQAAAEYILELGVYKV